MDRVTKTIIAASLLLVAGAAFAKYAYEERKREPEKLQAEREAQRIFRFGSQDVVKATLQAKSARIELSKDPTAGWVVVSPIAGPADREALESAFTQMSGMMQSLVVKENANKEDLAEYGLDAPRVRLDIELASGKKHALLVGAQNELQASYYVTDENAKTIWLAPDAFYWALDRDLFAFRGKRLLNLTREQVSGLRTWKDGKLLYSIRREGERYLVGLETPSIEMDPMLLNRLLVLLTRDLKADAIMTDALDADQPKDLAAFGLEPPHLRLEVDNDSGHTFGIRVGVLGEDKGTHEPHEGHEAEPEQRVYAWLEGTRTIAEVYPGLPTDLDTTVDRIRDRTISRFDSALVRRIEMLLFDSTVVELKLEDEGRWKFVRPDNMRVAKPWVMEELLRRFSNFRSDEFYQDEVPDKKLKEWMLAPPERRIAFFNEANELLADVRIGNNLDKERSFIQSAGSKRVDLIRVISLKFMPATLDALEHTPGG